MSRGMPSEKALEAALAIARARGRVIMVENRDEGCCDFLIDSPHGLAAVTVRRTRRLRAGPAEIAERFREVLNAIRAGGRSGSSGCEFWLWSPHGFMRFFAVEGFDLAELTVLGLPLVPPVTATFSGPPEKPRKRAAPAPAGTPAGEKSSPEPFPGPGSQQQTPGPVTPAPAPSHQAQTPPEKPGAAEPAPVRFLRRRNAGLRRVKEEGGSRRMPEPARDPAGGTGDPPAAGGGPPPG